MIVVYLKGPDGCVPNEGVAMQLAAHGEVGLGANFEDHEDEDDGQPEEDGGLGHDDEDEETAESESDDDDDVSSDDGEARRDKLPPPADAPASARHFNRRLTTLMPEPVVPDADYDDGNKGADDAPAPPAQELKRASKGASEGNEPPAKVAYSEAAAPTPAPSSGGCCVVA